MAHDDDSLRPETLGAAELTAARNLALATWLRRVRAEREAHRRYAELADWLWGLRGDHHLVEGLRKASEDESRDANLCAYVVSRLGAEPPGEPTPRDLRFAPRELKTADRLAYEIVACACVRESFEAALLIEARRRTVDRPLRGAMRVLARDKARHARLGFSFLSRLRAGGGGLFLAEFLPRLLEDTVGGELFEAGPDPRASAPARALGELPRVTRRRMLLAVLRRIIFPALAHQGVDPTPGLDWLAAHHAG